MTYRGITGLLASVVAVSSASWDVFIAAQATAAPLPWVPASMVLLPDAAAVVASILVLRATSWWRQAGLSYLAAFCALEAVGLVQIVPFASEFQPGVLWWSVATSMLALVTAALAVAVIRGRPLADERPGAGPWRWAAVSAGLLLMASSTLAWTVSLPARDGRWTFTLSHASTGVLVGSLAAMAVVAGITAVAATSSERALVVGATAGLLAAQPLAVSVLVDGTWQEADMMLAAGWWLALAAQVLLVAALVGILIRGTRGARAARDLAPTHT